jgi:hypothetical protein
MLINSATFTEANSALIEEFMKAAGCHINGFQKMLELPIFHRFCGSFQRLSKTTSGFQKLF